MQADHAEWGEVASWLLAEGGLQTKPRHGAVDAGDHPPITPVAAATREQAMACGGFDAWRLYELAARTFLASVSPDAVLRVGRASFDVGGEGFSASGQQLEEEGWYRALPNLAPRCTPLPTWLTSAAAQARFAFPAPKLEEGVTTEPDALSESELIGLMERHGIGTDASIATHVHTIEQRK